MNYSDAEIPDFYLLVQFLIANLAVYVWNKKLHSLFRFFSNEDKIFELWDH